MASVTTGSYLGFLVGPPIIGAIASTAGLEWALATVPVIAALSAIAAGRGAFAVSPAAS